MTSERGGDEAQIDTSLRVCSMCNGGSAGAAITNDWVVDNEHPYVGLAAFYDASDEFL